MDDSRKKKLIDQQKFIFKIVQWGIASFAFILIFKRVDWFESLHVIQNAKFGWLAVAIMSSILSFVWAALRWKTLLNSINCSLIFFRAYTFYLIGSFFSISLPGTISGDGVRIWYCEQETDCDIPISVAIVLLERGLGVIALFIPLAICNLFVFQTEWKTFSYVTSIIAMLGIIGVFILPMVLRRINWNYTEEKPNLLIRPIWWLYKKMLPLKHIHRKALLIGLCCSILFQLTDITVVYFISKALIFNISFGMLLFTMPIVYLATVLPITPGGLGIREGSLVIVLGQFGISSADSALLGLTMFINRVVIAILGGIIYLLQNLKVKIHS